MEAEKGMRRGERREDIKRGKNRRRETDTREKDGRKKEGTITKTQNG